MFLVDTDTDFSMSTESMSAFWIPKTSFNWTGWLGHSCWISCHCLECPLDYTRSQNLIIWFWWQFKWLKISIGTIHLFELLSLCVKSKSIEGVICLSEQQMSSVLVQRQLVFPIQFSQLLLKKECFWLTSWGSRVWFPLMTLCCLHPFWLYSYSAKTLFM